MQPLNSRYPFGDVVISPATGQTLGAVVRRTELRGKDAVRRFKAARATDDGEVAWHWSRLADAQIDDVGDLAAFPLLLIALSSLDAWIALVKGVPWLGRYALRPGTTYRVMRYFAADVLYYSGGRVHEKHATIGRCVRGRAFGVKIEIAKGPRALEYTMGLQLVERGCHVMRPGVCTKIAISWPMSMAPHPVIRMIYDDLGDVVVQRGGYATCGKCKGTYASVKLRVDTKLAFVCPICGLWGAGAADLKKHQWLAVPYSVNGAIAYMYRIEQLIADEGNYYAKPPRRLRLLSSADAARDARKFDALKRKQVDLERQLARVNAELEYLAKRRKTE
jgi:hypothetical protein